MLIECRAHKLQGPTGVTQDPRPLRTWAIGSDASKVPPQLFLLSRLAYVSGNIFSPSFISRITLTSLSSVPWTSGYLFKLPSKTWLRDLWKLSASIHKWENTPRWLSPWLDPSFMGIVHSQSCLKQPTSDVTNDSIITKSLHILKGLGASRDGVCVSCANM